MKSIVLLNHNENTSQVESEEKSQFLRELLGQIFQSSPDVIAQMDQIWQDIILTPAQKAQLRILLNTYNIQVLDNDDGEMNIYVEKELIGKFSKPLYKLKKDELQLDKKKQLFLEMTLTFWSVFDQEEIGK